MIDKIPMESVLFSMNKIAKPTMPSVRRVKVRRPDSGWLPISWLAASVFTALLQVPISSDSSPFSPQSPQMLVQSDQEFFMNPQWSPCGTYIAFTSARYRGIRIVEPGGGTADGGSANGGPENRVPADGVSDNGVPENGAPADGGAGFELTDEESAGYGFRWSSDGTRIAARTVRYDKELFQLYAIKIFDIPSKSETVLHDYTREHTGTPYWIGAGRKIAFLLEDSLTIRDVPGAGASDESPAAENLYLASDDLIEKYALAAGTVRKSTVRRFDHDRILNLALSPDRRQLAFQSAGAETGIVNTDGKNLRQAGRGENPVWMPDGEFLLVTVSIDDGHDITGSDIFAVNISTGERHKLTGHTGLAAMNPTVCPEGKRLVFSDYASGNLYIMNIR
jgi:Tol biopolymer transport system component